MVNAASAWSVGLLQRSRLAACADGFAVAFAVALPWSTTVAASLSALWGITLVASWSIAERSREPWTLAGTLPVALWVLAAAGMLWASVPWADRIDGLSAFHKLLAVAFLTIQFRDSQRGVWVLVGFLLSCSVLLVVSWGLALLPGLAWRGRDLNFPGIPVRDYISQSQIFTLCAFGLLEAARVAWSKRRTAVAGLSTGMALLFLGNVLYVAPSGTALVTLPVLLVLFVLLRFGRRTAALLLVVAAVSAWAVWQTSTVVRHRVTDFVEQVRAYTPAGAPTSAGQRLEFWRKSIAIIAEAPLLGHGTGSIRAQFRRLAADQTGMAAKVAANPHNQTFAVAIQLGVVGSAALFAMWTAHLLVFWPGQRAWALLGVLVIVQNIVGSLFNSHLFDFTQGLVYVCGVGVLGGLFVRDVQHGPGGEGAGRHQ